MILGLTFDFFRDLKEYSSVVTPRQEAALRVVARYSNPPSVVGSISMTRNVESVLRYINSR